MSVRCDINRAIFDVGSVRTAIPRWNSCGGNNSQQANACTAPPLLELPNSIYTTLLIWSVLELS